MDPMGLSCKSCGVDYDEHLGLVGTCAELLKYKAALQTILSLKAHDPSKGKKLAGRWSVLNIKTEVLDDLRKLVDG